MVRDPRAVEAAALAEQISLRVKDSSTCSFARVRLMLRLSLLPRLFR